MIVSSAAAQRRALFVFVLTLTIAGARFVTQSWAAGAFAVGKCGAYGEAYDYAGETEARAAALKHCKGGCTAVTMRRACAAFAIDRNVLFNSSIVIGLDGFLEDFEQARIAPVVEWRCVREDRHV